MSYTILLRLHIYLFCLFFFLLLSLSHIVAELEPRFRITNSIFSSGLSGLERGFATLVVSIPATLPRRAFSCVSGAPVAPPISYFTNIILSWARTVNREPWLVLKRFVRIVEGGCCCLDSVAIPRARPLPSIHIPVPRDAN